MPVALTNGAEYRLAERDVIEWLRSQPLDLSELNARIAATLRAERLAQLGTLQRLAGRGKLAASLAWIDDFLASGEALVVFARHLEVQEAVLARFPDALHLLGADSLRDREATIAAFQDPGGPSLIVAATRVAAQGITLTRASNVAFLELEWTPAIHDQAEDRCHRIGQHDAVTAWYLLAADTIDETMARLIQRSARSSPRSPTVACCTPTGSSKRSSASCATASRSSTCGRSRTAEMPGRSARPEDAASREVYAARAARAYAAMRKRFRIRGGGYRRDGLLHRPGTSAHLWPFSRAMFATLDLAGIPSGLRNAEFDADEAIASDLALLERYWDTREPVPSYSSDIVSRWRGRWAGPVVGGDRYYDDNAWVGLALVQLARLRPGTARLDRAAEVFAFAVSGWDTNPDAPSPGGVFWVEQVRGLGLRNHDRNAVSTAPNAQLGLHLAEFGAGEKAGVGWSVSPEEMVAWVNRALDAGRDGPAPATGLFFDKLRGDGTLDDTIWSYNQGSMIGANVLLARRAGGEDRALFLARAEAIARKALNHYAGAGYERQGPAFNAIFFRNLLLLHAASGDEALRATIIAAMHTYADHAWAQRRDRRDLFRFARSGVTLLDQSSITQILALLAWDPETYWKLA